jgi:hypothetical protein
MDLRYRHTAVVHSLAIRPLIVPHCTEGGMFVSLFLVVSLNACGEHGNDR